MVYNASPNTNIMMRHIIPLVFIILLSQGVSSQEIWTTDQYLRLGSNTNSLPFQKSLDFLENEVKGMPIIASYEFRTETDEMDLDRQQFQFRMKFNSREERKAYQKVLAANKQKYTGLQTRYVLGQIEERYKSVLDLYFLQKEELLIKESFDLLYDKKTVLTKILDNQIEVDVEDWINNENEIFELQSDSLELQLQKSELSRQIFGFQRDLPRLEDMRFISIETIKNRLGSILTLEGKHPSERIAMADREIADAEYQLEIAEGRKWLNFAQIEYQSDDKLSFQREVSLSTSIVLPTKNNNRVKKNEAVLDLLESTYELNLEVEEHTKEIQDEKAKLLGLIDQWNAFKILRENQKLSATYKEYVEKKLVSPLVLIGIKKAILRNARKQMNLEKDIYESYLTLLTLKGAFVNSPTTNFLSE